jgi:hypothetical protein
LPQHVAHVAVCKAIFAFAARHFAFSIVSRP